MMNGINLIYLLFTAHSNPKNMWLINGDASNGDIYQTLFEFKVFSLLLVIGN